MTQAVFQRQQTIASGASMIESAPASASFRSNVVVIDVTVTGDGRSGPYYPGPDCKSVQLAATGTCKFQIRGSGGTNGLADSAYRELTMSAEVQTATATKAGILTSEVIPYEFYLFDTSGSSNACTVYFIY